MTVNPAIIQRFADALNFRAPDRAPIWEMLQHPAAFRHFAPGVPFPECAAIACARLGLDATYGFYDVPPDGSAPNSHSVVAGQTVWDTQPKFRTPDELRDWPAPTIDERRLEEWMLADYDAKQRLCGNNLLYLPQNGGFDFIPGYDTETWLVVSEALATDLPSLERFWDAQMAMARARNAVTARHIAVPVIQCCIDVAYNTGLIVHPDILRAQFFPRFKEVIAPLKDAGIKVIWHSDGDISSVLEDAIAIGIDGINPLDSGAPGMAIEKIKRDFGERLILIGNIGREHLLNFGTPEQVRADVRRCLHAAGTGGGYIVQCGDGQITPDCPLDNVIAYLDEARANGYRNH